MQQELIRKMVINFLQWNDKNGYYTDERCDLEEVPRMTYKESIKYFFGVTNGDFYNSKADNIFELTYEEVIRLSKDNNFYEDTKNKLKRLIKGNIKYNEIV